MFSVIHNIHALSTDTHPDAFPNTMTPADHVLGLVDAGFAVNAGFPPLVRSHRHVDVILSLNYSWEQDQFKVRTWKTWKFWLKCKYQELKKLWKKKKKKKKNIYIYIYMPVSVQ